MGGAGGRGGTPLTTSRTSGPEELHQWNWHALHTLRGGGGFLRLRPCRRPLGSRSSEFRIRKSEVGIFEPEAGIPKAEIEIRKSEFGI